MLQTDQSVSPTADTLRENLRIELETNQYSCSHCGICVNECFFLQRHGDPGHLAASYNPDDPERLAMAFECNLCGLCTRVCPDGVDPGAMFLEMRREAFARGLSDLPEHRRLRSYERIGNSKRYNWYALPEGCDTVFFPGCALTGSRSSTTEKVFNHLRKVIPSIGIVLDCCNKPSHDLGDNVHFDNLFMELNNYLIEHGIKEVLVACPNCAKVFGQYASELKTRTIYEVLAERPPETAKLDATVTIHDPCVSRSDTGSQSAVRQLLARVGVSVREMPHARDKALCCGEGGGAGCVAPDLSRQWLDQRLDEAQGDPIISYCAGCTNSFRRKTTSAHVLDLLFEPDMSLTRAGKVTSAPLTYFERLKFKKRLQRRFPAAVTRERTPVMPTARKSTSIIVKIAFVAALVAALIIAHLIGIVTMPYR